MRLAMIEDRMRAHDEQFPQISIAHLRDAAQPLLAAGRVLSRRQAKKGGELTRAGPKNATGQPDGTLRLELTGEVRINERRTVFYGGRKTG